MVFKNQNTQDFSIQDVGVKRLIPNPNRLNNSQPNSNINKDAYDDQDKNQQLNLNTHIDKDLLNHLAELGILDIIQNQSQSQNQSQQQEVLAYIKNLDLEAQEKKQIYLQSVLKRYRQQQKIFEDAQAQEESLLHAFKFNPKTKKFTAFKYRQAQTYTSLLYILIWVALIVLACVYTNPLPPAYIPQKIQGY